MTKDELVDQKKMRELRAEKQRKMDFYRNFVRVWGMEPDPEKVIPYFMRKA